MPDFRERRGQEVRASDGARIGTLEEVCLDSETGTPAFLLVRSGLLGRCLSFAPVKGVRPGRTYLRPASSHDQVRRSPTFDTGSDINAEDEARIYQHHGFDYAAWSAVGSPPVRSPRSCREPASAGRSHPAPARRSGR